MWIMSWDLFLFYFFLNKVLVDLVNSAQDPLNSTYCLLKVETRASKKEKKKRKRRKANAAGETSIQTHT